MRFTGCGEIFGGRDRLDIEEKVRFRKVRCTGFGKTLSGKDRLDIKETVRFKGCGKMSHGKNRLKPK